MEPPPCIQNAMMRQTKKPFTYTPGGLDLSEIRSPRMARRLERNANYEGISEPRQQQPQAPSGPLPPSALAAMQPQMHVQVFPSGAPSLPNKAPPPPPPPQNRAVPPPPPMGALPTQKVCVDNQVLERPDMTKIIPENPMALLKKTGGPKPRNSFLDQVYNGKTADSPSVAQQQYSPPAHQQHSPPAQQQYSPPAQQQWSPPAQQQQWTPPVQQQKSPPIQQQATPNQWSPPIQQQRAPPAQWSPPVQQQRSPPAPSQRSPPIQQSPQNYQQSCPQQWSPPPQQQKSPVQQPSPYQPPIIERQFQQSVKSNASGLGSLYIPSNQQQKGPATPPEPPKRDPNIQSPGTPTLKEAPKPWQKQQTTQDKPTWAKRENISTEQNQQSAPQNDAHPNAVYVTQPLVFQHPGPPQKKNQPQGTTIINTNIPNSKQPPERLSRQQSWNNNPTQSNAFKVIQKITQTDDDDDYDDEPVVEHPPRYPQQFQQVPPMEQMRKMKMMEGDRDLMNRFKQDEDTFLHNEVDPRYRGAAIPSKAFKLLQSMTDGSSNGISVPHSPPAASNGGPRVRTIPIQIEGEEKPKKYVHPSEQTVPEPKKYTGSSIPSRSFKMLQAMTAPDNCGPDQSDF